MPVPSAATWTGSPGENVIIFNIAHISAYAVSVSILLPGRPVARFCEEITPGTIVAPSAVK
jgi:hypothetical protein